jgi:hypothetical protein
LRSRNQVTFHHDPDDALVSLSNLFDDITANSWPIPEILITHGVTRPPPSIGKDHTFDMGLNQKARMH